MTPEERKKLLGYGGLARIARRLRVTQGHISQVNGLGRPDKKARAAIAREIAKKHPNVSPADVWPAA